MDKNLAKYRFGVLIKKWWWSPFVWMVDVALQSVWVLHCIKKRWKGWVSVSSSFSKRCSQWNFSKIFKRREIIFEPGRNLRYLIRYLLWWWKTLPVTIWTLVYSEPLQTSRMECCCIKNEWLNVVNWLRKNTAS